MNASHIPVLLDEVLHYLKAQPGSNYIDATADGGGHAIAILRAIQPGGRLLAIEWDEVLFSALQTRLQKECSPFKKNFTLCRANYANLEQCAPLHTFQPVAGILFDLGVSSFHFAESKRGFSFQKSEPLDMRFSRELPETAAGVLASRSEKELETLFREFGEERFSRRIAHNIARERMRRPIRTTGELVTIIRAAIPTWHNRQRIHPATRTFQALRIAVNHEFENVERGLRAASRIIAPGGRIVVIAFHSLEERIIKNVFRSAPVKKGFRELTSGPITPRRAEILQNSQARSARLRAFEKVI